MTFAKKLAITATSLLFMTPVFADKDPNKDAIEARQAEMQLRSFFLGPLFDMAKGKTPYDAEQAQTLADNLLTLIDIDMGKAWLPGTDKDAYPEESDALPAIWTTYPEIAKYGEKHDIAVKELAEVAGQGQDALRSKVGAVGKSCKGCHDEYRQKD